MDYTGWQRRGLLIIACFLWAVTSPQTFAAAPASDPTLPKADELVKKFVARAREEDRLDPDNKFGYVERRLYDKLDKNGNVEEHSDETFRIVLLGNHRYPRLVAKDGKPLLPDEQRKQVDREKKFLDEQRRKAGEEKKDSVDDLRFDDQFLNHFKFDVLGRVEVQGRQSYVVSILPRPGNLPVRNNMEKIFTHMQGRVWVDAQDYSLVRCDLHLTEPTSFYGVLGSVRQLDLFVQQRWVDQDVWMPEKVAFRVDARKLFTPIRIRQNSEFSDFKKLGN